MAVKIPILILFHFCLLCYLSPFSIVAANCFNFMDPCRWFQLVLDRFRSFSSFQMVLACFRSLQVILDRFSSFQIVLARFSSFQMVLARFRSFQVILDRFRSFLTLVSTANKQCITQNFQYRVAFKTQFNIYDEAILRNS